jgi:Ca2+-binding EF-hand superfamily protein
MVGKLVVIVSFIALMASASVAQQSATPAEKEGESDVKKLLQLMDKDQNGKVSRAEFMSFMSAEFDRLDVNKDGELDVNELTQLRVGSKHPGGGTK